MGSRKEKIVVAVYLLVIYCWIPIELQIFKFVDWSGCSTFPLHAYLQGKYIHYVLLISMQLLGLIFSLKRKMHILTAFIGLNFFFFIVLYSIGYENIFDELGYVCMRAVN